MTVRLGRRAIVWMALPAALSPFLSGMLPPARALAQGAYARGDATCDVDHSAADVVATVRGLSQRSLCGNDDCDRDGRLTIADAGCATSCLFDECAVPAHAPRVESVEPESAPGVVPLSSILIHGTNFGDGSRPIRVRIGGRPAPLAEWVGPDTVRAVVPLGLSPGATIVVVGDGELNGLPSPVRIDAPNPTGGVDSLEGVLEEVDTLLAALAALDLQAAFGEQSDEVAQRIAQLRDELADARSALADDPAFVGAVRTAIDAAVESAGLGELLRATIADVNAVNQQRSPRGGATLAVRGAFAAGAVTIRVISGAAAAAATGTAATVSTPVIVAGVVVATVLAAAGSYLVGRAVAASTPTPLINAVAYRDANRVVRQFPTVGGTIELDAAHSDSTELHMTTAFGDFVIPFERESANRLIYRVPNEVGLCGKATLRLVSDIGGLVSPVWGTSLQPLVLSTDPHRAYPKQLISIDSDGTAPCDVLAAFLLPRMEFAEVKPESDRAATGIFSVPALPPAPGYLVLAKVDGIPSQESHTLEIVRPPTASLTCSPTRLFVPPGAPNEAQCTVLIAGEKLPEFDISWISSHRAVAPIRNTGDENTTAPAIKRGTADIFVLLLAGDEEIGRTNPVTLTVADPLPVLDVQCDRSALRVAPGSPSTASCTLTLTPPDATLPEGSRIVWVSSDSAAARVSDSGGTATIVSAQRPGSASISARIVSGSEVLGESNKVPISVADQSPPVITLTTSSPATVASGGSVEVRVQAEDNVQVDGIQLLVTGDAVESVSPSTDVPCLLQRTCRITFTIRVKQSGFLGDQITVNAQASDGRGNTGTGTSGLTFKVKQDSNCPEVTILAPLNGTRVRAGDVVQISARIADNRMGDSGVRRVLVDASGPAVAVPPSPIEVTLPTPLAQATRLVPFTVAGDLSAIIDRSIVITANAADDAGNLCEQPQTVTIEAGGAPEITSLSPNPVNAGETVTIRGQAFGDSQQDGSVRIGSSIVAVQSWSHNTIVARVPGDASGDVSVTVTADGEISNPMPLKVLGTGDVQVTLSWSGTNDLDLAVTEPSGETISYGHRMSASGGTLDVDANAGCGTTTSSPRENIFWPVGQAPSGTYQVTVNYFESCSEAITSTGITVVAVVNGQSKTLISNASLSSGTLTANFTR